MTGKISFLVGLGAGYVLGARAGRQRFEQIASTAQGVWQDPRVQHRAGQARDLVRDKAGEAGSKVADKVSEKVAEKVGSGDSTTTGS